MSRYVRTSVHLEDLDAMWTEEVHSTDQQIAFTCVVRVSVESGTGYRLELFGRESVNGDLIITRVTLAPGGLQAACRTPLKKCLSPAWRDLIDDEEPTWEHIAEVARRRARTDPKWLEAIESLRA